MMQHFMEFDEDHRDESRFCDHTFSLAEFTKDGIIHDFIDWNLMKNSFEEEGTDVGSQGSRMSAI